MPAVSRRASLGQHKTAPYAGMAMARQTGVNHQGPICKTLKALLMTR